MGTVPSPDIANLGGQIAAAPLNAFAEYQRAAQLAQQTQQAKAMAPGQLQQQQQQIEMQRRQMADQDALTRAMTEYNTAKHVPEDIPGLITAHGGSGQLALATQQHVLQLRDTASQAAQRDADTGSKNIDTYLKRHDAALGAIQSAIDTDDASLGDHLNSKITELGQAGFLRPDEVAHGQQLAQLASQNPQAARKQLPAYLNGFKTEQQIFKEAQENAKTEQGNWQVEPTLGVRINKVTGESQPIAGATMPPQMMEAKYIALAAKQAAGQPIAPDDAAFMKGYEKQKTLVQVKNFNLQAAGVGAGAPLPTTGPSGQPATYADQLKSFGPKGGVVKAIIEGRQDPPASFAQKSPYWQDVMQKVYAIDPEFNQQRAQLRKDYTVGKHSTEINAINTAMGHVGVMGDAIDALNNNDVQGLNRIANFLGVQVGQTPVTTFNTIVHRVGPELTKAYVGAGGGEADRGTTQEDFSVAKGPAQLKANVGITAKLLRSKISSLENQWDQNKAPAMPSFQQQFIMPEAQRQLDKWAPGGGGGKTGGGASMPAGATHIVPGPDGKRHYTNAAGTVDLGIAP